MQVNITIGGQFYLNIGFLQFFSFFFFSTGSRNVSPDREREGAQHGSW